MNHIHYLHVVQLISLNTSSRLFGRILIALSVSCVSTTAKDDSNSSKHLKVILLGGQSNAFGLGAVADLPTAITDYLADNYADGDIMRAGKRIVSGKYIIVLNVDGERKIIVFDADGNFLFERD